MKIEVWSDYVCPFCYIGKRQLEKAVADSGYEGQIEVEFKSFLLDPTTPVDAEGPIFDALAKKFNTSVDEVKKMTGGILDRAKELGLNYNYDVMKTANTVAAHRLTKWAATKGKEKQLTERLLQAYFIDGIAIGRQEELLSLAQEVGLPVEEAKVILMSNDYQNEVDQDIYEAQQIGVRGVPFFVFDNKYGISGAQPQQLFEQTIEQAASEAGLKKQLKMMGNNGSTCTDDNCEI